MAKPPKEFVDHLLSRLRADGVCYFPIRHHSPACAAHLRRWIAAHKPASILVEGPASFTPRIEFLVHPECQCPVALYTTFVDKKGRLGPDAADGEQIPNPFGPPRFAAYYPLCDYSPELVALRAGKALGARLRFIDLEYPEMVLTRLGNETAGDREGIRVDSLAADSHLRHSEYIQSLARRMGCRDFNELWDHLFEAGWDSLDTDAFIDRVAAYCAMARLDYTQADLDRDGTTAREACMAAAIRAEIEQNAADKRTGPILVVTGGFHTVALPDLVVDSVKRPKPVALGDDEAGAWLMRYSFDQLDALAGYASGMPSPAYYDRLWHAAEEKPELRGHVVADVIVEIARLTRTRNHSTAITTPDAIAALQMTRELAKLRGHPWPLREDVLDGMRSCFVKGEMNSVGQLVMSLVREVLAGNRVGRLPPGCGVPPIVDDFHREARLLRLPVDNVERRELVLDLYRDARHRQISRLLHRLDMLGAPFAQFQSGPDFVQGSGLELMQEHWQVCWSPATESALIEASVFGPTVAEAAAAKLRGQIAKLEEEGQGRNTAAAVTLLIRACRLGLHEQAGSLIALIDRHVAEDPSFPSVVTGLSQLELLDHAREPLEATHLTAVPALMTTAYQRACRLMADIALCPDELVDPIIGGLRSMREVLVASNGGAPAGTLDPDLFHAGLRQAVAESPQRAQATVVGAAAGVLFAEGKLTADELIRLTLGYLGGTVEPRKSCGILRGLLATAREIAWQVMEVISAVDEQFQSWDEATFLGVLPELRLAFAGLTPREISQVADRVAGLLGAESLGELVHMDISEEEVPVALEITRRVRATLSLDFPSRDRESADASSFPTEPDP